MLENYEKFLDLITGKINGFFEKQKPYISCQKGCSMCCESGEYPWSYIEYKYLMEGFHKLDSETKRIIVNEVRRLKKEKRNFKSELRFMHKCPFLINKVCSVYEHRGIICRSFGLLAKREGKKPTIPFCASLGLNYSSVYDEEKHSISDEKFKQSGIEVEPLLFNVDYKFLTNDTFAEGYGFEFGEKKPLLDWLEL